MSLTSSLGIGNIIKISCCTSCSYNFTRFGHRDNQVRLPQVVRGSNSRGSSHVRFSGLWPGPVLEIQEGCSVGLVFFSKNLYHLDCYYHAMQVCYWDLKLENTLLDGSPAPRLKICDFGYSKTFRSFINRVIHVGEELIWAAWPWKERSKSSSCTNKS